MKKIFILSLALVLLFTLTSQNAYSRPRKNLYEVLKDAKEVNTYVADVIDSSGQAGDMLTGIKRAIEDELTARMSTNFVLVKSEEEADIIITCDVTERIWLKDDPVDQVYGAGAAAMDIAMKQNYGRLKANFEVKKGPQKIAFFKRKGGLFKRRNILWQGVVKATITKTDMPESESKPLLERRLAEVFMLKCFSKKSKPVR